MHIDADTVASIDLASATKEVRLEKGVFASALRKLDRMASGDGESFKLVTQTAVAGVRGTIFFVKAEDEGSTYVCTCNGELHVEDPDGGNERDVAAAHHEAYWYRSSDEGVGSERTEFLFHTDEMMERGAALIGETIDWATVGP